VDPTNDNNELTGPVGKLDPDDELDLAEEALAEDEEERPLDMEVPEADAFEQRLPVTPDDSREEPWSSDELLANADPADIAEQRRSVPPQDDYPEP